MGKMELAEIKIGKRYRKDLGNIEALAADIDDIGLLHPIVITPQGRLIAGRRRLAACKLLGWSSVDIRKVDLAKVARGEYSENAMRKDFTPSEQVAIGEAVEPMLAAAAKERMLAGVEPCGDSPRGKTRDQAAKKAGMGGQKYTRAKAVCDAAEAEPDKYAGLVDEMDRTGRVNGVFKKLKTAKQAETIGKEPPPLPKGPFRVIIADPPWTYGNRPGDPSHRSANPYPSMTLDAIKAYVPKSLSHKDCILWLWTTNAHMRESFEVAEAWGFTCKTILTWAKHKMGTGEWLRGKTEHCLMCVRGKPTVVLTNQTTLLEAPTGKHSAKPDAFYDVVAALCPGSTCELFQRTPRKGIVGVNSGD